MLLQSIKKNDTNKSQKNIGDDENKRTHTPKKSSFLFVQKVIIPLYPPKNKDINKILNTNTIN
jgi:hypothetical protein